MRDQALHQVERRRIRPAEERRQPRAGGLHRQPHVGEPRVAARKSGGHELLQQAAARRRAISTLAVRVRHAGPQAADRRDTRPMRRRRRIEIVAALQRR